MDEKELIQRTKAFAVRVVKLCAALPRTPIGRLIQGQLLRAGTSVGANYRAACRGRSVKEFTAKLGIVEEEADESAYWLEMIVDGDVMPESRVAALHTEAEELTKIMAASRKTASGRFR